MAITPTLDPNLPEENTTIIANATMIQERVVVPKQRIIWYLHGWERGPVVVADQQSILLFDLEGRQLHTISLHNPLLPTYVMHKIFNVFTEAGKVGADIHFSPAQAIQPVSEVDGHRWLEVVLLSRVHQPTYQRLLAMRD
jgi:hypothetical protein